VYARLTSRSLRTSEGQAWYTNSLNIMGYSSNGIIEPERARVHAVYRSPALREKNGSLAIGRAVSERCDSDGCLATASVSLKKTVHNSMLGFIDKEKSCQPGLMLHHRRSSET